MTTVLIAELVSGLCMAAAAVLSMTVGAVLVLGRSITMDASQREPRVVAVPAPYPRRVRGSSTSRTVSPRMFTARIRPKSAVDAAVRFQPMIGSRASSSRA